MSFVSTLEKDGKKLVSVLSIAGRDADKGLAEVSKYLPEAATLAELIFPADAVAIKAGTSVAINITAVVQNTVIEVEAKSKLIPAGLTGLQKSADVLTIVSQAVLANLKSLGYTADTNTVQSIINAVVAILNIPTVAA